MFVHVCGVPAKEASQGLVAKWPRSKITYFEDLQFNGLTRDQVAASYDRAASLWSVVSGVELHRVDREEDADIVAHSGPIDGPMQILALSDLPYGATDASVMHQTFDGTEPWSTEGLDMLVSCMCHEIGHALGLEHIPNLGALMDPYIVPGRDRPQPPDAAAMKSLYGPPVEPTPAVPPKQLPDDSFERLGHFFSPYLVGPWCDMLVEIASFVEQDSLTSQALLDAHEKAWTLTQRCWFEIVWPALNGLGRQDFASAHRSIAKGLSASLSK